MTTGVDRDCCWRKEDGALRGMMTPEEEELFRAEPRVLMLAILVPKSPRTRRGEEGGEADVVTTTVGKDV
jgi:hypothetical protein